MSQSVNISIQSIQYEGEQRNRITSDVKGDIYYKHGIYYIKYEENLEGLKGVKTTLKLKDKSVSIIRQGMVRSIQEFNLEERTDFNYNTPYGVFNFSIGVEELDMEVGPLSGRVDLDYILYEQNGEVISRNILNILYEEG